MWASTRSSRGKRARLALALAWALCVGSPAPASAEAVAPPPLPSVVQEIAPGLVPRGGGRFTFFGLSVYDGWYWTAARGWPAREAYALDLVYHRDFDGTRIAERSVHEMANLDYVTPDQRTRWGALMARIFPDVRKGDRLTGVHTDDGAVRYFHNGRAIGSIDEPGFARAFFGIWLDPKSSRADFRRKLLGNP